MLGLDLEAIVNLLTRQTMALEHIADLLEEIAVKEGIVEEDDGGI
jgi:hypothetical protein